MARSKLRIFYPLLLVFLFSAGQTMAAGTTYYKWLDERGEQQYGDRPPPAGIEYEVVSSGSSMVRKVAADEGAVPATVEPTVSNDFTQQSSDTMEAVEKNPEFCKRAQDNLNTLNSKARIRLRNSEGEYRYLTEEEKETQRRDAQESIKIHC